MSLWVVFVDRYSPRAGDIPEVGQARTIAVWFYDIYPDSMAKRTPEDYAELSRAVEAGEYTAVGPIEMGTSLHEGRPIDSQPDPTADEVNEWLDSEEINPADARDATHFRRIRGAVTGNADQAELEAAVAAARDAGDSWAVIGAALGTSRQDAYQRFGQA